MSPRSVLCVILIALHVSLIADSSTAIGDSVATDMAATFRQHCGKCHGANNDDIAGDVDLLHLTSAALTTDAELVRTLIRVLDLQEMPPEDQPPLAPAVRQQLVAEMQRILETAVASGSPFPHTSIRRMNRFQYNNAVIDLLELKCIVFTLPERMMRDHGGYFQPASGRMPEVVTVGSRPLGKSQLIEQRLAGVAAFPQDLRAEHGFDNRADHLSLSPLLMEAFLKLGQSITQSPDFNSHNVGIWQAFFAAPADDIDREAEVRRRLDSFLTRAFRHPAQPPTLRRYASFVNRQLNAGVDFPDAMKSVVAATIASPNFLYLYNTQQQEYATQPGNDFELASRLSFFLWGSVPDQELLELATAGNLANPQILDAQIDRMLKDTRLKRFCDSFPSQWLQLERIISSIPNRDRYPDFYFSKYRNSMHMMLEPLLLFETVLIENQPITQLIDSDFTYRSNRLETAYGSLATPDEKPPGGNAVQVLQFQRRPVSDRRSGGVITNAAVMTMTSGPERTQPITRGAWLATVIFNHPPEPPPADVPPLGEKPGAGEEHLTLRERLALHRKRADCRGCHEQIDPLGFALENYNAIGVWRDRYENERDVDMAGQLFRQHSFTSVAEFKDALLTEKDRFTRALAGHLLSFALARELAAADQPALDRIVAATAAQDYRMQTLVKRVILSEPFCRPAVVRTAARQSAKE